MSIICMNLRPKTSAGQRITFRTTAKIHPSVYVLAASLGLALAGFATGNAQATAGDNLENCASCHTVEAASFETSVDSLASVHSLPEQGCTGCHDTSSRGFAIVHKITDGKDMPTELKRTEASVESCSSCHNAKDLAKTTENVKLMDEKGVEVNPHDLPSNESHDTLTCFDCHNFHGLTVSDATVQQTTTDAAKTEPEQGADTTTGSKTNNEIDVPAADGAAKQNDASKATGPLATTYNDARSLCISCHHAGVYECGTCH